MRSISILVSCIAVLASIAAATGIFSSAGPGPQPFTTVHGQEIMLYGKGVYRNMSAEVAPQGIAQDVVTLFIGVPLLLISLWMANKGSMKGRLLLAGTLGYFLVTYLFFILMAMYNQLFLLWAAILGASFFAFILVMMSFNVQRMPMLFTAKAPVKLVGGFLIFNAVTIALLWLSIVVPPLLQRTVPVQVEHYTTLVVQALDLSILLPAAFVCGRLLYHRKAYGYLLASVYIIFLSLLMIALVAKIIAMGLLGYNIFPVIIIIPLIMLVSVICSIMMLKNVDEGVMVEQASVEK